MTYQLIGAIVLFIVGLAVAYLVLNRINPLIGAFGTFIASFSGLLITAEFGISAIYAILVIVLLAINVIGQAAARLYY